MRKSSDSAYTAVPPGLSIFTGDMKVSSAQNVIVHSVIRHTSMFASAKAAQQAMMWK